MLIKIFSATVKQWVPFSSVFTEKEGMPFGAFVIVYWSNGDVGAFTNVASVSYLPAANKLGIGSIRHATARVFQVFDAEKKLKIERVHVFGCDRNFDTFERVDCCIVTKLEEKEPA